MMKTRDVMLGEVRELAAAGEAVDFLVIGGGATGLGVAVDAASRGHSVVLVEGADFAKGTSSRSTKLVHGGVRYLQQGNISLVLEALRERGRLAQNAPHLVRDLEFVIPAYRWWEKPFYAIGLKIYDWMAGKLGLGPSRWLSREATLEKLSTVNPQGLSGGVGYYDGQFDDARLAVNLAQTARDHGALVVNYVRAEGITHDSDGKVTGARLRDVCGGEECELKARCVVNATGIFVDELRQSDVPGAEGMITVSQGVHVVLPRRFLPGDAALMIPKTEDGRVLFAVPWHGVVVVGTTDTPLKEKSLEPRALEEEVEFVIAHAQKYLTGNPLREDVLSVYAGLRPLVGKGEDGDTSSISRDHTIVVSQNGLLTVTGGKWTTYRKMAEDVVDEGQKAAGLADKECVTVELKLHGWLDAMAGESEGILDGSEPLAVYGADAEAIAALEGADVKVQPQLSLTEAEVRWHCREEMAVSVEDVLARRSRSLLLNAQASAEAALRVAEIMAEELGKDADWVSREVRDFEQLAKGYMLERSETR